MRLGQDVIHIEEEEEQHLQALQPPDIELHQSVQSPDDALTAEVATMLNTSTVKTDGEIEHAAVREAAVSDSDAPLDEVVTETKNRWRDFGRRAVAKTVLPLIEYSGISALTSFKIGSRTVPTTQQPLEDTPLDYDPEQIESSVDTLLEDVKKSRRISKKSLLKNARRAKGTQDMDDNQEYVDNIQKLYHVDHQKAVELVHKALQAAKSDPKGPKIVELHKKDTDHEVFGVKIQVEGGPAISFAPSDIHTRLKYIPSTA